MHRNKLNHRNRLVEIVHESECKVQSFHVPSTTGLISTILDNGKYVLWQPVKIQMTNRITWNVSGCALLTKRKNL